MKLKIAAIQSTNFNGDSQKSLQAAEVYVQKAVKEGARFVLCPEFLACGYGYESSLWEMAEESNGLTVRWLREQATRHNIYIGATFFEISGGHFYNTFVLFAPGGKELGRVYKDQLPNFETFFYRGKTNRHVIETELGRIGVGICFENQRPFFYKEMKKERVDLILMPHCYPPPTIFRFIYEAFRDGLVNIAPYYANAFGVPVVLANKSGNLRTGFPFVPFVKFKMKFPGASCIAVPNGTPKWLDTDPGYLLSEVSLGCQNSHVLPKIGRYWVLPSTMLTKLSTPILAFIEWTGRIFYRLNFRTPPPRNLGNQ